MGYPKKQIDGLYAVSGMPLFVCYAVIKDRVYQDHAHPSPPFDECHDNVLNSYPQLLQGSALSWERSVTPTYAMPHLCIRVKIGHGPTPLNDESRNHHISPLSNPPVYSMPHSLPGIFLPSHDLLSNAQYPAATPTPTIRPPPQATPDVARTAKAHSDSRSTP